jgi:hypothetical protein
VMAQRVGAFRLAFKSDANAGIIGPGIDQCGQCKARHGEDQPTRKKKEELFGTWRFQCAAPMVSILREALQLSHPPAPGRAV